MAPDGTIGSKVRAWVVVVGLWSGGLVGCIVERVYASFFFVAVSQFWCCSYFVLNPLIMFTTQTCSLLVLEGVCERVADYLPFQDEPFHIGTGWIERIS